MDLTDIEVSIAEIAQQLQNITVILNQEDDDKIAMAQDIESIAKSLSTLTEFFINRDYV